MTMNTHPETGIHYGVIHQTLFNQEIFFGEFTIEWDCEECPHDSTLKDSAACFGCDRCLLVYKEPGFHMYMDDETNDVWVLESPYTTTCGLCSPCAPNAGDISSQDPDGYEAYAPPPEWLDDPGDYDIKEVTP